MEVLKRFFKAVTLALALSSPVWAETIASDTFGYLNNNESPVIIGPAEAQDLLNVDVTPSAKSVKKRSGYGLYKTLGTSQALHGGIHFYDTSGNDVQVWGSSRSLYGIVTDGTPTQLVSSATLNTTWDCADTQGFAYCATSSRDALIRTNGTTISWYSSPLGTMVTVTPLRLVVAGVAAAPNSLYFSEANNFTNFTPGITAASPFIEPIAAPGSRITNVAYACDKVLWWKDESFGYLLGSEDQDTVQIVTIANNIGSQDNSTATDPNGNVYFRGQDGHIYKYDCASLEKLTTDITPNIQSSGRRTSNSWALSTVSDFSAGSTSGTSLTNDGVVISTTNVNVQNSSFETSGPSTPPPSSGSPYWFRTNNSWIGISGGSPGGSNCTGSYANGAKAVQYSTGTASFSTMVVELIDATSSVLIASTSFSWASNSCSNVTRTISPNLSSVRTLVKIRAYPTNSTGDILTSDTFTYSGNAITFTSASDTLFTDRIMWLDFFQGGVTDALTGVYYSPVRNASSIATWDTFSVSKTDNGGTHAFSIRSSPTSFTVLSATPVWTSQAAGAVISISTGVYFQFKDTFTVVLSSQNPKLQSVTINWFEGSAADKAYGQYFDNAIWWSVAFGAGQASNNYIFKYDLLNPGWTLYDFGTGGFLIQNNSLYFGSVGTNGNIYKYGNSTSDAGNAITAYWKSKDYPGSDPWLENEYTQFDLIARRNAGQTLSVGYSLNGSTTSTSYDIALTSSESTTIRHKKLLPTGKISGLFNVQFSDSSSTSAWEVIGWRVLFRPLPYKPTQ